MPSISMSSAGFAGGVGESWHSCIVLSLLVMRLAKSLALASCVVSVCTFSRATTWRFCSVAKSIALISSSWSGAGLLTTTVSDVSVSGDSVGESIGDPPTLTSTMSGCACFGCVGFFAPGWSWPKSDSSPVPCENSGLQPLAASLANANPTRWGPSLSGDADE